ETESPEPVLAAPSPASFGIEYFGPVIKLAMAQTFERQTGAAPARLWPTQAAYIVPADAEVLPIPGAHNFRYSRVFRLGSPETPKVAAKNSPPRAARPRLLKPGTPRLVRSAARAA